MTFHAGRGTALLLAFVVASAGILPCACTEMSTAETSGGHCGPTESGLWARSEACTCACMTAQDGESATQRVEPVLVRTLSVVPASHAVVPGSCQLVPPIPLRHIGHSPPPSQPLILRSLGQARAAAAAPGLRDRLQRRSAVIAAESICPRSSKGENSCKPGPQVPY